MESKSSQDDPFTKDESILSLEKKRGLLKRSRALTVDMEDRGGVVGHFRSSLKSLPEYESSTSLQNDFIDDMLTTGCHDDVKVFPSIPDRLLKHMGLYGIFVDSNKNLNEPDIEEKYARLSLAFKTDKFTLCKRLDLQLRQRDIAEKNIDSELKALRESLNALNQLCAESEMRDIITKTQQHVDIVQQATMRMSSRAETYGAIQQEQRMNCAFETMLNYVEHLKLLYDKEHLELEEYRRLLAEHNLLPDDKNALEDDAKRTLPPRSQSLSCSSKPELLRRGSLGTVIRSSTFDSDRVVLRENTPFSGWSLSVVRQKLEARTRLLSAVCLLNNNNCESSRSPTLNSGSLSPKSRRSSLPVGPLAHSNHARMHTSINEKHPLNIERKESSAKASRESHLTRTESEESTGSKPESDNPRPLPEEEDPPAQKDSSEVSLTPPKSLASEVDPVEKNVSLACSLQESTCDNEKESDIRLLPDIIVPVKSKPFYVLSFLHKASIRRMWRWDNATVILHVRYSLSAILATAAMLMLVLTFIPNQVLALVMND